MKNHIKNIWSEIAALQKHTKGEGVKIAILDGPIDTEHPCFLGSQITTTENKITKGMATIHGTHVASIMLGNDLNNLRGVCPAVECISIPIFREHKNGSIIPSSQFELARSIEVALNAGADIINISAGEKVREAEPQNRLKKVIERCIDEQVLIVSAVGNDGCPCIHVPAVHSNVLAVGALSQVGSPMSFSNWGSPYQFNGIMAPGENILGAVPGGGYAKRNGTSFAAPIVSGVIGLIYSYFKLRSKTSVKPLFIKEAILNSSHDCPTESSDNQSACDLFLKGILNISGTLKYLERNQNLTNILKPKPKLQKVKPSKISLIPNYSIHSKKSNWVVPSVYTGSKVFSKQLVYCIGTLDIDFETDAILDSYKFYMQDFFQKERISINFPDPYNPHHLSLYLNGGKSSSNLFDATRVTWLIKQSNTPLYAIKPLGAFSEQAYQLLVQFLNSINTKEKEEFSEYRINLCSIPGHIIGKTKLRSGAIIPVIKPNIRAMYNWKVVDLINHVLKILKQSNQIMDQKKLHNLIDRLASRLSFKLENLGVDAADRALNHAAANLFNIGDALSKRLSDGYELDDIQIQKSNHCRPDSDCQDVIFSFFKPSDRIGKSKHVFRFTIDVSKVIPVSIGEVREWFDY